MKIKYGFWSLTSLLMASMIGAGLFTTTGYALETLGSPAGVMLVWFLGAMYSLAGVWIYSHAVKEVGRSGGEYKIVGRLLNPFLGFMCGWISIVAGFTGPIVVSAQALDKYLGYKVGFFVIIFFGFLEYWHQKTSLWLQNFVVFTKILSLFVFVCLALALSQEHTSQSMPMESGVEPIFTALVWILFSYSGWNSFAYIYDEIDIKNKKIMWAPYLAVILTSVIYLVINAGFLFLVPAEIISGKAEVGKLVAEHLGGEKLGFFVSAIIAMGMVTAISSLMMMGPVVLKEIAVENLRPQIFKSKNFWLFMQTGLACVLYFSSSLIEAIGFIGYLLTTSSALVGISVFKIKNTDTSFIFKRNIIVIPFVFVSIFTTLFLFYHQAEAAYMSAAVLASGIILYLLKHK